MGFQPSIVLRYGIDSNVSESFSKRFESPITGAKSCESALNLWSRFHTIKVICQKIPQTEYGTAAVDF